MNARKHDLSLEHGTDTATGKLLVRLQCTCWSWHSAWLTASDLLSDNRKLGADWRQHIKEAAQLARDAYVFLHQREVAR